MHDGVRRIHDGGIVRFDPAIAELVAPIAAYICAADDPGEAILIIAVHLGIETSEILGEARTSVRAYQTNRSRRDR